jgi:hypothetical protein
MEGVYESLSERVDELIGEQGQTERSVSPTSHLAIVDYMP